MTGVGDVHGAGRLDGPDGTPEAVDDRALLQAHVGGDPDAFGQLFQRHRDRLWAVALRTVGDPEEAADALQDAMLAAFRRADSFRGDAAVSTWLHRVVVNACLDRLRRRRVRQADPLPDDPDRAVGSLGRAGSRDGSAAPVVDPSRTVLDPAEIAVDAELRAVVLGALARLPLAQRAALVLVDMEGYSVEEAAAILECAPGTVKSRCFRGRAKLLPLLVDLRPGTAGNPPGGRHVEPHDQPSRRQQGGHPRPEERSASGGGDER